MHSNGQIPTQNQFWWNFTSFFQEGSEDFVGKGCRKFFDSYIMLNIFSVVDVSNQKICLKSTRNLHKKEKFFGFA